MARKIEFKSLPVNQSSFPSGSDPRSSTTVVLFEEFVPLEYRQELAKDSGSKRRLPFFFSASMKSKQWKPAATLNGRPYVIGHVPKSPSYREVEFEGLLRSNGSKVLTLSKPAPMASTLAPPSPTFPRPRPKTPRTSPQYDTSPPQAAEKEKCLERTASDSPLTPASNRRSRFRIPVPNPASVRRSGLVPAEYSTVDFETRLASYSDDEWNETASVKALTPAEKHERRMSRDDAWVDILVASQSRRLGTQEVDLRVGSNGLLRKGGRSDPELASQEVAQVLAGVRARSPLSDDDEIQPRQVTPEPPRVAEESANGVLPENQPEENNAKNEDPDVDSVMSYPKKKRVGYFDLHPERLPVATARPLPVRPRVNGDCSDGDDVPDEMVYGMPERASSVSPAPQTMRTSLESASEYAPTSINVSPRDNNFPEFTDHGEECRERKESGHSRAESTTLPHVQPAPESPSTPLSQSKTAALIEMYREREKQSLPSFPSHISPRTPPKDASLPPLPPHTPSPSSRPIPQIEIEEVAEDAPEHEELFANNILHDDAGRSSPGRYVHGMPLQNVIEEEEEE